MSDRQRLWELHDSVDLLPASGDGWRVVVWVAPEWRQAVSVTLHVRNRPLLPTDTCSWGVGACGGTSMRRRA